MTVTYIPRPQKWKLVAVVRFRDANSSHRKYHYAWQEMQGQEQMQ